MSLIILLFFCLLFALELLYFKIADYYNIIDKPNERSSHSTVTLRGGGIIFYIGAFIWWLYSDFSNPFFFIGLSIISIISFIDDIHDLTPKFRLSLQLLSISLMTFQILIDNNIIENESLLIIMVIFAISLFISAGAINVFNFMDGINGITGGYSLIVLLSLAYPYYQMKDKDLNLLIIVSIIAVIVFSFFNFRKKAKCFAGDVGSVSIAFIIIFLIGKLIFITKDLSWLTLVVVYGVDGVMTICHRILLHENLSQPHRKHAYQIMANELKIPHTKVTTIYMIIQATITIFYFIYPTYLSMIICISVLCLLYILFMKKYYHLHKNNKR